MDFYNLKRNYTSQKRCLNETKGDDNNGFR